jgi:hypothetical protein
MVHVVTLKSQVASRAPGRGRDASQLLELLCE